MEIKDAEIDAAVVSGVDFLLQSRHTNGLWFDFRLAPGWSDEWVSGYVGDRIAAAPGVDEALSAAWQSLAHRSRVRPAGWGYNAIVPQDADSTSWTLRLAMRVGELEAPQAQRGLASLVEFRHENGLLGTYCNTLEIRAFIRAEPSRSLRGWTSPHACVTAAAAALPGIVEPKDLLAAQRPDGSWRSYWWEGDSFATALATEALGECEETRRAAEWAASRDWSDAKAFDIANDVITCAIAGGRPEAIERGAAALLARQQSDGSWPPGAVMLVPDPGDLTPWEEREWVPEGLIDGAIVEDVRGVFTTATAVRALLLAKTCAGPA